VADDDARRADFKATALPHMDALYSTALYLSRNPEDAADLVQDTFLRAYRSWDQFQPGTNCKAWLMTILYNAFRNRYRAQRSAPVTVDLDDTPALLQRDPSIEQPSEDPADLIASQVLDGEVEEALEKLPPVFRDVVVLVDIQELSYEEAASVIGCPVGTVRSRLSRGRQFLYEALKEYAKQRGLLR
jgi:RNA polymerase sigma-70 factor (ECF subfamily)